MTTVKKKHTVHVVLKCSDDNPEGWVWEGTFQSLADAGAASEPLIQAGYQVATISKTFIKEDSDILVAVPCVTVGGVRERY